MRSHHGGSPNDSMITHGAKMIGSDRGIQHTLLQARTAYACMRSVWRLTPEVCIALGQVDMAAQQADIPAVILKAPLIPGLG